MRLLAFLKTLLRCFRHIRANIVLPWVLSLAGSAIGPAVGWKTINMYSGMNTHVATTLENASCLVLPGMIMHIISIFSGTVGLVLLSAYYLSLRLSALWVRVVCWTGLILGMVSLIWFWALAGYSDIPYDKYYHPDEPFSAALSDLWPDWSNWVNLMRLGIWLVTFVLAIIVMGFKGSQGEKSQL